MSKTLFGCRIHFKNGGTDKVVYHNTVEEADAFFAEKAKQFKAFFSVGETPVEGPGYYEDDYVVLSKEDIVFPDTVEDNSDFNI